ncbi:MAG TPA: hypothetical protein VM406_08125 [Noviherbaspirillum sp.]|nr:hypothetical protein [Noviherbaspirillum sp.]
MEKQAAPVNSPQLSGARPPLPRPGAKPGKARLDRTEISRCINIWASVYRLREPRAGEDELGGSELQMPPRTWTGRSIPRADRFK